MNDTSSVISIRDPGSDIVESLQHVVDKTKILVDLVDATAKVCVGARYDLHHIYRAHPLQVCLYANIAWQIMDAACKVWNGWLQRNFHTFTDRLNHISGRPDAH